MRFGGFIQPQYRVRQDAPGAPNDTNGFRLARARFTATGSGKLGNIDLSSYVEAELQPSFSLYDAYVTARRALPDQGEIAIDLGQTRTPISMQQLISDTRRSFVEAAQIQTIAPDRDLGLRLWFTPPKAKWIRLIAGAFNGEGRNQVQNINESLFYAGRLEFTPFGKVTYAESAFAGNWLSAAISAGYNKLTPGMYHENDKYLGYDISGAWDGLSGSYEYLQVQHDYQGDAANFPGPTYLSNGWVAQVAYLLPMRLPPFRKSRLELGFRVEEIDRNNAVPITMIGDPNQSSREYTAVVSYYLREHTMKLQIAASHFTEVENHTATGADATYPNDQILAQLTYRVE